MPLNIEEITTLFHFPVSTHSISTLRSDSAKLAPAPSSVSGDGVLIGINEYQGVEQEVYFHRERSEELRGPDVAETSGCVVSVCQEPP